jgi:hypothetical protein
MNKWAYKKLPTCKTQNKIVLQTPKADIPKRNFSLLSNPLKFSLEETLKGSLLSSEDNKTGHLKDKKLLTTTKPQEPVKLIIDNPQLRSNLDIGMNIRHSNHFNTCILWLRAFFKNVTGPIRDYTNRKTHIW